MFSLDTIDVAIGLALLFLILSLLCTSLREALESLMKTRASDLERGIRQLLQDDGELTRRFYEHPLIYSLYAGDYQQPDARKLYRRGGNLPSYIPSNQFARAIMDLVQQGAGAYTPYDTPTPPLDVASLRAAAAQFPNPQIRRAMLSAIDHAHGDLEAARRNIETWFNGSMDRVSGWYKRRTQVVLFGIGLLVAILLNVDAITVAERLQRDKALRAAVVAEAQKIAEAGSGDALKGTPEALANRLDRYGFPIGWKAFWPAAQLTTRECHGLEERLAARDAAPAGAARDAARRAVREGKKRCGIDGMLVQATLPGGWVSVLSPGAIGQMLIGWLITAVAMMLGAPFWFDVLNRLMVIRSTVKPTEKSGEEGSEDRPKASEGSSSATGETAPAAAPVATAPTAAGPTGATGPSPAATAQSPGGFPFVANQWAKGPEEGVL